MDSTGVAADCAQTMRECYADTSRGPCSHCQGNPCTYFCHGVITPQLEAEAGEAPGGILAIFRRAENYRPPTPMHGPYNHAQPKLISQKC